MNKLIEYIQENDIISIFRHINPDGDALGSQWGIANFIKENYPTKTVYVCGNDRSAMEFFPNNSVVSESELKESAAIVLDSATQERIDGSYHLAKSVLNIDHHPSDEPYGDVYVVDSARSSTCEIVAELLYGNGYLSEKTASFLLAGILTDTNRFSIETTKPATLRIAAQLIEEGANITRLTQTFFSKSYADLKITTRLINEIKYDQGLATMLVTKEIRDELGLTGKQAKLYNYLMANIKEFEIYCIFVEEDDGTYSSSLRSKNVTINTICNQFGGGGHRLACGIRGLSDEDIIELKDILITAIKDY